MARRSAPHSSLGSGPPASSGEGAAYLQAVLIDLFDRRDGTGADWVLMLDSVFRAGFAIADERLSDDTRRRLMQRVYTGAYDRAAGNSANGKAEPEKAGHGKTGAASSDAATSKGHKPRPQR